MRRVAWALGVSCVLANAGCRDASAPLSPPPSPASDIGPVSPSVAGEKPKPPPVPKLEIVVGGCKGDCADGVLAANRFIEATAGGDPARIARFLDATRLAVDGEALGAEWSRMQSEGRSATRRDAIETTARSLAAWTQGLAPDRVRGVVTAGPRVTKRWSTEVLVDFEPPGHPPWTLTLRPRGLEWLVVEVRRGR